MQAPRLAEGRDEEVPTLLGAIDLHRALPEVDLERLARPRLEAHRGARGGLQRRPQGRDRALDGPERHGDLGLTLERLPHHIGIPVVLMKAGGQPGLEGVQHPDPCRRHGRALRALRDVLHYVPGDAPTLVERFAGVRPLLYSADDPGRPTREYVLHRDGQLVTVLGGKWTTALALAGKVAEALGSR